MKNIWFTSDPHYGHRNIVRGTSSWERFEEGSSHQSTRDFNTLEEHNQTLIDNFNQLVKPNDEVFLLGDVAFGGHSHGTLPGYGKSMDVGVDTNNLFPYHLDEIMDIMRQKEALIVDHHNQNTN